MAYKLAYSDYSTTDTGPPDPERWIGPPGPPGPQGEQGIPGSIAGGGPFLPLSGGHVTGKLQVGSAGWLEPIIGATENISDFVSLAKIAGPGGVFGTRTSDGGAPGSQGAWAIGGFAVNNNSTTAVQTAYGSYLEARRYPNAGTTHGAEICVVNEGNAKQNQPYYMGQTGSTLGLWLNAGRDDVTPNNDPSLALGVIGGNAQWDRGIVFGWNSVRSGVAIGLPPQYSMVWYLNDGGASQGVGVPAALIRSDATSVSGLAHPPALIFGNGSLAFDPGNNIDAAVFAVGQNTFQASQFNGSVYCLGGLQATPTPIGPTNAQLLVYQGTASVSAASYRNIWSPIGTVSGSSPGSSIAFNTFQISGDNSTTASNVLMELSYYFGGSNFSGMATGLSLGLAMNAASIAPGGTFYMGANIFTTASASAGGANTTTSPKGNWYGLNLASELTSGATNYEEVTTLEVDSAVKAGASVSRRVNMKICLQSNHAIQGTVSDTMLQFSRLFDAPIGSRKGIVIGGIEGLFPLDNTNGVFIDHEYSRYSNVGITPQVKTFIDASHIRALTAHWLSPGASIDGSGNYTTGPARLGWSAIGASLDVFGQVGGTPTILAGGVNAANGQIVTTGNGDLYTATVVGGAITALTVIVPATSRTTGVAVQTLLGDGISGATCTIPWSNARTLSLQPGGGAIVAPLLINAANDAGAASAGVAVGQLYRNASVVMQRVA